MQSLWAIFSLCICKSTNKIVIISLANLQLWFSIFAKLKVTLNFTENPKDLNYLGL